MKNTEWGNGNVECKTVGWGVECARATLTERVTTEQRLEEGKLAMQISRHFRRKEQPAQRP